MKKVKHTEKIKYDDNQITCINNEIVVLFLKTHKLPVLKCTGKALWWYNKKYKQITWNVT